MQDWMPAMIVNGSTPVMPPRALRQQARRSGRNSLIIVLVISGGLILNCADGERAHAAARRPSRVAGAGSESARDGGAELPPAQMLARSRS